MSFSPPQVNVFSDAAALTSALADALVDTLTSVTNQGSQTGNRTASLVLTGGGIGIACLAAVRQHAGLHQVNWGNLALWWGDERYVPTTDSERNDHQAFQALLEHVPLEPEQVHCMPAPQPGSVAQQTLGGHAQQYNRTLVHGLEDGQHPFDLVLLGVGPDGHVASLFPGQEHCWHGQPDQPWAVAVHESPKPPPLRISMSLNALTCARQVWLMASGEEKAPAVAQALQRTPSIPASLVHGTHRTLWWLDRPAASALDGQP